MEMKMTQTIQNNIKKKKKVVKLPLHDFKTHSLECYTVKTVQYQRIDRSVKANGESKIRHRKIKSSDFQKRYHKTSLGKENSLEILMKQ